MYCVQTSMVPLIAAVVAESVSGRQAGASARHGRFRLRSEPEGPPDGAQEGGPGVACPLLARRGREALAARLEAALALGEARGDVVGNLGTGGEERAEGGAVDHVAHRVRDRRARGLTGLLQHQGHLAEDLPGAEGGHAVGDAVRAHPYLDVAACDHEERVARLVLPDDVLAG